MVILSDLAHAFPEGVRLSFPDLQEKGTASFQEVRGFLKDLQDDLQTRLASLQGAPGLESDDLRLEKIELRRIDVGGGWRR